jgi:hypothetical protein
MLKKLWIQKHLRSGQRELLQSPHVNVLERWPRMNVTNTEEHWDFEQSEHLSPPKINGGEGVGDLPVLG